MKRFLPFLFVVFFMTINLKSYTQNKISSLLLSRIEKSQKSNQNFPVLIVLSEQLDYKTLNSKFKAKSSNSENRAKTTIRELQKIAKTTQSPVLSFLKKNQKEHPSKIKNITSFWIANIISAEISPDIIYDLQLLDAIKKIDLNERKFIAPKPIKTKADNPNSKDILSGIEAINAPALWKLGYTGRNRIALSFDTGVNFKHPALNKRFLGNHLPMKQCLHSFYNFEYPQDIASSTHGTHTTGTILGLDETTNDTIGIAYNAYWIETDPIVSSEADIRPFTDYMETFEWVLNPDGDTATVSDIPDVVNNSWGISRDHELYECDPIEAQILDAVDAAGIGNIFSAGNEGTNPKTIGMPADISHSLVNVFSVGAISGANPTFPIADFSSCGPTTCYTGDDASLLIKPEVVAPGVNVRSSIGNDDYGTLSGTSMASPHVSGAFLLLKEAFPELPGNEILLALYNSAVDLGDPGEDNTYGKGIIDVYAAFELLSQTHTPKPPVSNKYDIAVKSIANPAVYYTTSDTINPKVVIINKGTTTIKSCTFYYNINNLEEHTFQWTGSIATNEKKNVTLPSINTEDAYNTLNVKLSLDIDTTESDIYNNYFKTSFTKLPEKKTPLFESFNYHTSQQLKGTWAVSNPDFGITWVPDSLLLNDTIINCVKMNYFNYKTRDGQEDILLSPIIDITDMSEINFKFSYSYIRKISHLYKDSLKIYASTNQGETFDYLLFCDGGEHMASYDMDLTHTEFIPTLPEYWKDTLIDISNLTGNASVILKFVSINDNGNNLYIDNVKVYEGEEPTLIKEIQKFETVIYPNPAKTQFILEHNLTNYDNAFVEIYNTIGKLLLKKQIHSNKEIINVSNLENGIYFVRFRGNNCNTTKKIYINK